MKLEKVAVVEIMVIRHTVVLVEKVVAKEKVQIMVLEEITVLVLVALKVLRFVRQRALHFH